MKRYFVNSCNGFVVPGKSSFAYLRTLGVSEQAIFTAPNAVDNSFFATRAEQVQSAIRPNFEKSYGSRDGSFCLWEG